MITFSKSPQVLFTSESVTEGHPDKLCDQIADAVLDACLKQDPLSRVACEVVAKTGFVLLMGEITTQAQINYDQLAREVIVGIGYNDSKIGFDGDTCGVQVAIGQQSPNIAQGVNHALEEREGTGQNDVGKLGAGDQGMMVGYACKETPMLMPMPIELAHRLARRLAQVRKSGELAWLRPDGKTQVTIEYNNGQPKRVHTVLVSAHHAKGMDQKELHEGLKQHVISPVLPPEMVDDKICILTNPTGSFEIGGPLGDSGLSGRKIIVDTYGGMARHGGGSFSGKDATKVDRSGAYAARWVAKHLVAAGLAERCEVHVAYAIGKARPLSVFVETFGTGQLPDAQIKHIVDEVFDLRPGAIIRDLGLRRPIFQPVSVYGHFGRDDLDLPWERLTRLDDVKSAAASK